MEISRLFFSKETQSKLEKKISPQHKGKLRWERLKEAEANGALQHAKKRVDIGKIVGVEDYKTAYSWVSGLIRKGAITESIVGFENGLPIHEYHLGTGLEYGNNGGRGKKARPNVIDAKRYNVRSLREQGRIRWENFMKKAENGDLAKCTNRKDVIKLSGYTDKDKAYSWIMNMITRGHLVEEIVGVGQDGAKLCKYSIGTQPNFALGNRHKRSKKVNKQVEQEATPRTAPIETIIYDKPSEPVVLSKSSVIITYGELTIKLEQLPAKAIGELVTGLLNKVIK